MEAYGHTGLPAVDTIPVYREFSSELCQGRHPPNLDQQQNSLCTQDDGPGTFQSCVMPRDCQTSEWSSWSPCSKTCRATDLSPGYRVRGRTITQPATGRGKECPILEEKEACNIIGDLLPRCPRVDVFSLDGAFSGREPSRFVSLSSGARESKEDRASPGSGVIEMKQRCRSDPPRVSVRVEEHGVGRVQRGSSPGPAGAQAGGRRDPLWGGHPDQRGNVCGQLTGEISTLPHLAQSIRRHAGKRLTTTRASYTARHNRERVPHGFLTRRLLGGGGCKEESEEDEEDEEKDEKLRRIRRIRRTIRIRRMNGVRKGEKAVERVSRPVSSDLCDGPVPPAVQFCSLHCPQPCLLSLWSSWGSCLHDNCMESQGRKGKRASVPNSPHSAHSDSETRPPSP
ncbi:hypothetical protein NFI96_016564 [Prochilodus magdalenae]|nr:hypothetical protein NFI96_016564 [Prochilodus magdalenae]